MNECFQIYLVYLMNRLEYFMAPYLKMTGSSISTCIPNFMILSKMAQFHQIVEKILRIAIALNQAHEQNNAVVKGGGGAIGLTQNPEALRRWMISGPELARIIGEFEQSIEVRQKGSHEQHHHEQTKAAQVKFAHHVHSMCEVMEDFGNPFQDETAELLRIDNKDIMDSTVIRKIENSVKIYLRSHQKKQLKVVLGFQSLSQITIFLLHKC